MRFSCFNRASIFFAISLAACGGAVAPSPGENSGTGTTSAGTGGVTTGSGTSSATASTTGSESGTATSSVTGGGGSEGTGAGTTAAGGPATVAATTGTTTASTTTGNCGSPGAAGGAGAGGAGAGGASGVGASDGGAGTAIPRPANMNGFVLRYGDFPPFNPTTGTSGTSAATTTGGTGIDPDTQYVTLGTEPTSCMHPYITGQCGFWQVSIAIPPSMFKPGTLSLSCLNAFFSAQGPDRGGGDCSGGGGSFFDGTIEILSVDAAHVVLRLANTQKFDFNADGYYDLSRCP